MPGEFYKNNRSLPKYLVNFLKYNRRVTKCNRGVLKGLLNFLKSKRSVTKRLVALNKYLVNFARYNRIPLPRPFFQKTNNSAKRYFQHQWRSLSAPVPSFPPPVFCGASKPLSYLQLYVRIVSGEHKVRPYEALKKPDISCFPQFLAAFAPVPFLCLLVRNAG